MAMMTEALTIRPYAPSDYPAIKGWWEERGADRWPESLVPRDGVIVENADGPICSGWLFMIEGMHAAFFHGMVTKPGLGRRAAYEAISALIEGLDITMRAAGRTLILGTVPDGVMLTYAAKLGFKAIGDPVNNVVKVVTPQNHGN